MFQDKENRQAQVDQPHGGRLPPRQRVTGLLAGDSVDAQQQVGEVVLDEIHPHTGRPGSIPVEKPSSAIYPPRVFCNIASGA
jgi:hypothetical protein